MIDLKQILVPVDFSDNSYFAVDHAMEMAKTFDASIVFLHVMEDPDHLARSAASYAILPDIRADMQKEAKTELAKLVSRAEELRLTASSHPVWGTAFVEIVRYAREHDIDLIMMGTHGRGAISHLLLGNVAERVVQKAHCPVMTIRPKNHEFIHP